MFSSKIQHLFFVSTAQFNYKNPSKSNIQQTHTQTYELGTNDRVFRFKNNVALTSTFILYLRLV